MKAMLHALSALDSTSPRKDLGLLIERQNQYGSTVFIQGTFLSREEAEDAVEAYLESYDPAGYGTGFNGVHEDRGYFVVHGSRCASCD